MIKCFLKFSALFMLAAGLTSAIQWDVNRLPIFLLSSFIFASYLSYKEYQNRVILW